MDYLLDTHAIIWAITDEKKLSSKSKALIENKSNKCFVSIVSFWEIGIKCSLGRLELKTDLDDIFKIIEQAGFETLPVSHNHILESTKLPLHHNDPFDRLIIGQAMSEKMTLITKDKEFKRYECALVW